MIQGIFGELQLAQISITELRKQKNPNTTDLIIRTQPRQSQIFSQNAFHIEIKRPNFDSIQLNHPLLQIDLNDILNSKFFEINGEQFDELMKKNQQYLDKYKIYQEDQVDLESCVGQQQIQKLNMTIVNKDIMNQKNISTTNKVNRSNCIEQQKTSQSYYPYINNPIVESDKTISEKDYNDIMNYFQQKNNRIDRDQVKFFIEACKTKDPKSLFEFFNK